MRDSATLAIDVSDLGFSYGDSTVVSMERCQLSRGQSLAVIGSSGCGKTTFLHLLAGLIRPGRGAIRILGQDLTQLRGASLDRFRGRIPALPSSTRVERPGKRAARTAGH